MTSSNDPNADDADKPDKSQQELESLASDEDVSLAREFYDFLRTNKKWWLSPILIVLAVLTLFVALSLSPAAPFIYTLF